MGKLERKSEPRDLDNHWVGTRSTASGFFDPQVTDAVERVPTTPFEENYKIVMLNVETFLSGSAFNHLKGQKGKYEPGEN